MTPGAKPAQARPRVDELLDVLVSEQVRFVVAGSVAAAWHGVPLEPGDLDVVPALDRDNLARLASALQALDARPVGPFGHWEQDELGERKWIGRHTTDEELAAWRPDPDDVASVDHLMLTRLGDLDVVPRTAGLYDELASRAVTRRAGAHEVAVASLPDVLAGMTRPRRVKDVSRVKALRERLHGKAGPPPTLPEGMAIRDLRPGEAARCEQILRALPDWFGIEESLLDYVRDVDRYEAFGVVGGDELQAFLCLRPHGELAAEVQVMAVQPDAHRGGLGRALLHEAERRLRSRGVPLLQVKTLGPSRACDAYARTRRFYRAQGFLPLEETTALWGEANPTLILVKPLTAGC
jgi:GNAT superfamily N-acetyltransferase